MRRRERRERRSYEIKVKRKVGKRSAREGESIGFVLFFARPCAALRGPEDLVRVGERSQMKRD